MCSLFLCTVWGLDLILLLFNGYRIVPILLSKNMFLQFIWNFSTYQTIYIFEPIGNSVPLACQFMFQEHTGLIIGNF